MAGLYVVIEGIEGSGKTTHARMLHDYLSGKGVNTLLVREPGTTKLGEKIRSLLLSTEIELCPLEEFLLFSTARSALHNQIIIPACAQGKVVISDRNYLSSVAYQGHGAGLSLPFIYTITAEVTQGNKPDFTEKNQKAALFRVRMNGEFLVFLQRKSSDFLCIKRHCLFLCPKNPSMRESVQSSLALKSEGDAFDGFL